MKFAGSCLLAVALLAQTAAPDPLARAIADFAAVVGGERTQDQLWLDSKGSVDTALTDARTALAAGRRWFALERFVASRQSYYAVKFTIDHPAERKDLAALEREWTRRDPMLGAAAPKAAPFTATLPAAVRALAEVSLAQSRINFDAGLEYGRNTQPEYGLQYVGMADGQRQFVELARTFTAAGTPAAAPALRSIASEIAAVQTDLLALYRPPTSIDKHAEFIAASSALKEARQYDAEGLRHAAMFKLLQGAMRTAALRNAAMTPDPAGIATQLKDFRTRLTGRIDHSIAMVFLERAEVALEPGALNSPAVAAAVALDVLPRYFAAIEPLRPSPSASARTATTPPVTVTLVRWPFT